MDFFTTVTVDEKIINWKTESRQRQAHREALEGMHQATRASIIRLCVTAGVLLAAIVAGV